MFARATLFEIDTMRTSTAAALDRFKEVVMPALRSQPGYRGVHVMHTPEGRGMILSLWETEADAEAGVQSGFHDEQLAKFVSLFRSPPGREHYEVVLSEVPAPEGRTA